MMRLLVPLSMIVLLVSGCDTPEQGGLQDKAVQAEATEQKPSLVGTSWRWVSLVTPGETVKVAQPNRYLLGFQAERKLAVHADCNRAFGNYEAEDGRLVLRVGGMTRAMCPPESLSDRFVKELGAAAHYRFDKRALYVELRGDLGTMKFLPSIEY